MNVIYLLTETVNETEAAVTRVPFYDYDKEMFQLLTGKGGGVWDRRACEVVFRRKIDTEKLRLLLPEIPLIETRAEGSTRVYGFFGLPWADSLLNTAEMVYEAPESYSVLADKFPAHWQEKLEAELRVRKYSPKTRCIYRYFNRLICKTLQKTPEEMTPGDVTQFLADIEKDRDYSASSINLALSSMSLRRAEPCGIFSVDLYRNGGSFCKEIYYTVWFNTSFFDVLLPLSRSRAAGY